MPGSVASEREGEPDFLTLSPDFIFDVGSYYTDWGTIKPVLDHYELDYNIDNVGYVMAAAIYRRVLSSVQGEDCTPNSNLLT